MDGQTDRILVAIPRLHCMQRGKMNNKYTYIVKSRIENNDTKNMNMKDKSVRL